VSCCARLRRMPGFSRNLHSSPVHARGQEDFLQQVLRSSFVLGLLALLAASCLAQNQPTVSLETNETLFTVLTAINTCGYDQELDTSDPLRAQIRKEVRDARDTTVGAPEAVSALCQFYREHQSPEPARDLAQYISLALYLQEPPAFTLKVKQTELPPDAVPIAGFVPLLQPFYEKVGLHKIWEQHRQRYSDMADVYHDPISKMTFDTEIYLKLPSAGYLGRRFVVYMDAMGAPGQTNARNYASDYYVVISPSGLTKMQQIRHLFLHYELDPLAMKNGTSLKRLEPLLDEVKSAPMDEAFKSNISLLVTECLVRAIEARTIGNAKTPEAERLQTVEEADKQGYVLTRYFYDELVKFEKDPAGLRNVYTGMLGGIDVGREMKRASLLEFAGEASPELLHLATRKSEHLLLNAERRLAAGDKETAQKLALEALDTQDEDAGRAFFILAEIATSNGDMDGARSYFEKALQMAHEPKVIGWSHIYLGRIFDIQKDRDSALNHYASALNGTGAPAEVKAAAQRGIQQPYEAPTSEQPQ
jgi:tetratricopeptide (TPR) repeat protein